MTIKSLTAQFVARFPEKLEPDVLYLAMEFATAAHLCACGCGNKVITPFSPTDWQMFFDGETVSLKPSIGNWTFRCRSHYWVRSGRIEWAGDMSQGAVNAGRKRDAEIKAKQSARSLDCDVLDRGEPAEIKPSGSKTTIFGWVRKWLGR